MLNFTSNLPLSLYVHLPWCIKKCPYCDFNSHAVTDQGFPEATYINALIADLESALPDIHGRPISSIFIGGGTPSLFSAAAIDQLMTAFSTQLSLDPNAEVTIEANPGQLEAERFKAYRQSGVNRISIGIQSFSNAKLKRLCRIHDRTQAINAIATARDAGFEEINIDLMFGLPNQTIEQAMTDLQIAVEHEISHISWYQLTIEPNTVFYKYPPPLPNDGVLWRMQQQGQRYLSDHGFSQYEISAYARDDATRVNHQCRHNLNYWQFADYLGIGAGAHSKLTQMTEGKIKRYIRHRIPQKYIQETTQKEGIASCRVLTEAELPLEFMMNTLRLRQGFHPSLFSERTGLLFSKIQTALKAAKEQRFIEWGIHKIHPTEHGYRYLNNVLQLFM